jgi:hypothetical protein
VSTASQPSTRVDAQQAYDAAAWVLNPWIAGRPGGRPAPTGTRSETALGRTTPRRTRQVGDIGPFRRQQPSALASSQKYTVRSPVPQMLDELQRAPWTADDPDASPAPSQAIDQRVQAWSTTRCNARTEGYNRLITQIKRAACECRACGRTRPVTSRRGRSRRPPRPMG